MSLTTTAYYTLDINVPVTTNSTLTAAIARYEPEIVRQLLGYDIAKLVLAYNPNSPGDSSQIIRDIVEGKEYAEGNYTVKWNGLLNAEKVSILAYYVFIKVAADKAMTLQNIGVAISDVEAGETISPAALIRKAGWELRRLAGYPGQDQYAPSLYNFMKKHESSYPTWLFNEFKPINEFGI